MTPAFTIPYVNFPGQYREMRQEILSAVEGVFTRGDYILGEEVSAFESSFAALCGVQFAVSVANGTDALMLALKVLGVGPGDEVITVPNSFIATAASIALVGAQPVFVDVDEDFLMDPTLVEKAITSRTKVIMPVHLTGRCVDMDPVLSLAKEKGLKVVEDAAQSVGSFYKGRPAGSLGILGCFSLHPLKNLNAAGDAGIISTNDFGLAEKLKLFRNHGLINREESAFWGHNSRLDTIQAAVLNRRMPRLKEVIRRRRMIAEKYRHALNPFVTCPRDISEEGLHTYHVFIVQSDQRDSLKEYLAQRGVETKIHYPIPIHLQKAAAGVGYKGGSFPVCERQAKRMLSLPIHPLLTDKDVTQVIEAVIDFHKKGCGAMA